MLEQANEVQEMLGRSYGLPEDIDEADLDAGRRLFYLLRMNQRTHPCLVIELEALGNELEMEDDPSEPSYLEEAPEPKAEASGIEKAGSVPQKEVPSPWLQQVEIERIDHQQ